MTTFKERISGSSKRHGSRVVLALDFGGPYDARLRKAMGVLEAVGGEVAAVKVNSHLLLPYGLQGIRQVIEGCRAQGLPLIADLKMNDIEATNLNAVDSLMDFGFDGVIANPFVGKDEGLGRAMERVHSRGGGMILLVYMSHAGAAEGYSLKVEDGTPLFRVFAERARDWGADGVVVSAKDPDKVAETRRVVGEGCLIFTPGVGAQGGDSLAPVRAGADFVIVGRSVTEAQDPAKAVRALNGNRG